MKARCNSIKSLYIVLFSIILAFFSADVNSSDIKEVPLSDDMLEARAQNIFVLVRCMVCNGETIRDSNAKLSVAMRDVVRRKILDGESDSAILDFIRLRYGNYAVLEPPSGYDSILLKAMPILLLCFGILFVFRRRRRINQD